MATYLELQEQIKTLQREADALRSRERKGVIVRMKEAIAAYEISADELGLAPTRGKLATTPARTSAKPAKTAKTRKKGGTAAVAYADSKGNTWAGRGKRPNWLREALANGAKLEDFVANK